jgi:hypothetical protein
MKRCLLILLVFPVFLLSSCGDKDIKTVKNSPFLSDGADGQPLAESTVKIEQAIDNFTLKSGKASWEKSVGEDKRIYVICEFPVSNDIIARGADKSIYYDLEAKGELSAFDTIILRNTSPKEDNLIQGLNPERLEQLRSFLEDAIYDRGYDTPRKVYGVLLEPLNFTMKVSYELVNSTVEFKKAYIIGFVKDPSDDESIKIAVELSNIEFHDILLNNFSIVEQNDYRYHPMTHLTKINLRIRSEPDSSKENVITVLSENTLVEVLEEGVIITLDGITAPWYKISTQDGVSGWCFSGYLQDIRSGTESKGNSESEGPNYAEPIIGTWSDGSWHFLFNSDGTFSSGMYETSSGQYGQWRITGNKLILTGTTEDEGGEEPFSSEYQFEFDAGLLVLYNSDGTKLVLEKAL